MINVPDNFPAYTSYSPKTLLLHVDILKNCVRELQQEVSALKAAMQPNQEAKSKKEIKNA